MLAKTYKLRQVIFKVTSVGATLLIVSLIILPNYASALSKTSGGSTGSTTQSKSTSGNYCGGGDQKVQVSIDFGCQGKGNPIEDMIFAVIKLLSDGVGIVVIASLIVAGIQFTSSRGDPQATAKSMHRVQSNVTALILFFFAYAILNYVVPGAILK